MTTIKMKGKKMNADVTKVIQEMIAGYLGLQASDVDMSADLDLEYDMDSTELTDFAQLIEKRFSISIDKSHRRSWETGCDIAAFVAQMLSEPDGARVTAARAYAAQPVA
ncbi:acyl carrier protein [Burkholderia sp. LMG 21824]|uniref:acyl carrier protein n=1 Tax=Burkholderia sp. LMG 21824 TaxID=3158172 RepID=UPI003C2C09C0